MNRNLYVFGIFFALLYALIATFQNIIYFQLDRQIFALEIYRTFYVCATLISVTGVAITLKYFRFKKFDVAFWSGLVSVIAGIIQAIVLYTILNGQTVFSRYYIPVVVVLLLTSMVYSISLIFSKAAERPWLKIAGISVLILNLVLLATLIWAMSSPNPQKLVSSEKIQQWVSLIGGVVPLFFALNFLDERRHFFKENLDAQPAPQRSLETILVFLGMSEAVAAIIVCSTMASQSYRVIDWNNKAMERSRRLAEPFEAANFVNKKGDTLRYRFFKPGDYDSQKKYPLVVCLHHGGAHGSDNVRQLDGSEPAQVLYQNRVRYPAILFVPQCPAGAAWGGINALTAIDSLVFEAIADLEQKLSVDETKRYVIGISGGGFGSWHFIATRPALFAAAVPICGGGDTALANKMSEVAIWAFHGEKDNLVPAEFSRNMIDAIKKAGGNPRYTEFKGAGHNIWTQVKATPDLWDWMFAQKRD